MLKIEFHHWKFSCNSKACLFFFLLKSRNNSRFLCTTEHILAVNNSKINNCKAVTHFNPFDYKTELHNTHRLVVGLLADFAAYSNVWYACQWFYFLYQHQYFMVYDRIYDGFTSVMTAMPLAFHDIFPKKRRLTAHQ